VHIACINLTEKTIFHRLFQQNLINLATHSRDKPATEWHFKVLSICHSNWVCPLFDVIVLTSHANANPSRLILLQNWSQDLPSSPRRGFQKSRQRVEKTPFVILPCASESLAEFVRGRDVIPTAT
jgi:hypothetical protein